MALAEEVISTLFVPTVASSVTEWYVAYVWWYVGGMLSWVLGVMVVGIVSRLLEYRRAVELWIHSEAVVRPDGLNFFDNFAEWFFPLAIPGCAVWPLLLLVIVGKYASRGFRTRLQWWLTEGVFCWIERRVIVKKKTIALTSPNRHVRKRAQELLAINSSEHKKTLHENRDDD